MVRWCLVKERRLIKSDIRVGFKKEVGEPELHTGQRSQLLMLMPIFWTKFYKEISTTNEEAHFSFTSPDRQRSRVRTSNYSLKSPWVLLCKSFKTFTHPEFCMDLTAREGCVLTLWTSSSTKKHSNYVSSMNVLTVLSLCVSVCHRTSIVITVFFFFSVFVMLWPLGALVPPGELLLQRLASS